jgi:DUF4097 and DUF4098 domain-containing protein YvlB
MRHSAIALIAFTLVATPAAAGQKQSETVDRVVPLAAGGTLKLNNFSGDVRITGTGGRDVVIHAVRTATSDRLANIKLDIVEKGNAVEIEANHRVEGWQEKNDNVVHTTFEIQVPADARLDVHTFSGALTIKDVTGRITAKTFSGSIDLDLSPEGTLAEIQAETFSGSIKARVPPNGNAQLGLKTFSGELSSDVPVVIRKQSKQNITADLGTGAGAQLQFKTFSGDVKIVR